MKNHILSTIVIILALLTACAPQPVATPTPVEISASAIPIATNTPIAQLSPTPTATVAPATATKAPHTAIPQPTATQAIEEACINLEQKIPDDLVLSGVWVINPNKPYLENLADHMVYTVPLKGGGQLSTVDGDMAISPDGTHLAYIDKYYTSTDPTRMEKRTLRVIRSSGHSLDMSFWVEDWQWLIGWVDNENLAIATANKQVVILNPITGNWRTFNQPEWVGGTDKTRPYYLRMSRYPLYDPTLKWILERPDYGSFDLKNVQTGETVWQTTNTDWWKNWSWSVDTGILAMFSDKSVLWVVNTREKIKFDLNGLGNDNVSNPKLSPDGQKIAFQSLPVILDINQRKLTGLCDKNFHSGWYSPTWSPDSRFVVQEVYTSLNYHYESYDILIDTQEMRAYLLKSGYSQHRIAWLAQP